MLTRTGQERKALDQAAAILRQDLDGYQKLVVAKEDAAMVRMAQERIAALQITIAELEQPRGWNEALNFPRPFGINGSPPKPWAMMAPELARATVAARQAAGDHRAGIGNSDGPVIKFVGECLKWITPEQDPPGGATIFDVVKDALAKPHKRG